MFNFEAIDHETDVSTRFSVGCLEMAVKARQVLLEHLFACSDISEGPAPERSEEEKNRAAAILGKIIK